MLFVVTACSFFVQNQRCVVDSSQSVEQVVDSTDIKLDFAK